MIQNLFNDMTELLRKKAPDFFVNEKLNKNKVTDAAYNYDKNLLKALFTNESLKKQFFVEVEKILVFKLREFLMFLNNKSFLQDSFTRFKNEIGLQDEEGRYFRENTDVVLVWPHKDCILEGGQTKEDQSREEIFYNETLAPDEIDRLLDTKALTNFTHYGQDGKKELKANTQVNIREQNLIIRGNNLLALHSLKARNDIAGKVKLIYIDPPYNTGSDSFKYNDNYNHSTWLTFMSNRLKIAKDLLRNDGCIFISIDDHEIGHLKCLCDEIFNSKNFINVVSLKTGESQRAIGGGSFNKLRKKSEYLLVYCKNPDAFSFNPVYEEEQLKDIVLNKALDGKKYEYRKLLSNKGNRIKIGVLSNQEEIFEHSNFKIETLNYSVGGTTEIVTKEVDEYILAVTNNFDNVFRLAESQSSILTKVRNEMKPNVLYSLDYIPQKGKNKGTKTTRYFIDNSEVVFLSQTAIKTNEGIIKKSLIGNIWTDIKQQGIANEGGVKLKFGKKPEKLIKRILELTTEVGDIVIDFHIGSGTSIAVAHKMQRRYIGIEQIDYKENDSVVRIENVIHGDSSGISSDQDIQWQGGGSLIYCEIKEFNQKYINKIQSANKAKDLWKIWELMKSEAFLRIEINRDKFTEDAFSQLEIEEQKRVLLETLDKNHLYVNLSELEDEEHKMTKDEIALNKKFFNIS